MRLVDILWAFPFYVLVIAIVGSLGPSIANMYLAFALVAWISFARIVRGEVLILKQQEFVQAALLLGYPRVEGGLRDAFRAGLPCVGRLDGPGAALSEVPVEDRG